MKRYFIYIILLFFQAMRTPERDESGVALIFEYFNQLYFIDRRFFPPDRSLGVFFEWSVLWSAFIVCIFVVCYLWISTYKNNPK